jgi:putative ABC transport system permease protein
MEMAFFSGQAKPPAPLWYVVRGLLRSRTFTIAAVLALALGIGAGTAVFSVVDRILFRNLPYAHSGRLVSVGMLAPIVHEEFLLGYDYFDWRATQTPFEAMGSWNNSLRDCDLNDTRPLRLRCARADSTLLSTLGIQPVAGRAFTAAEERPNAPRAAIISHALFPSLPKADRRSSLPGQPGASHSPW